MLRAYQFAIYPNKEQEILFAKHFGCVRWVYNWGLSEKKQYYETTGKSLSKRALQDKLVLLKKEKPWLQEVNSQSLLATLFHLENAFRAFFQKVARFPNFKSKKNYKQTFHCPQHIEVLFESGFIKLPKIELVKAKLHRQFKGQIKTCTVKKTPSGRYFISVLVEDAIIIPTSLPIHEEHTLGCDRGIKHFLVSSDAKKYENPRHLEKALIQLSICQKQHSRKKMGSNNRAKSRIKLARYFEKVANRRRDTLHKLSHKLLSDNQTATIALEDLNIKGMQKNRRLSRHIADAGWGIFEQYIKYKALWRGKNVVYCGRFDPSSKSCPCGFHHKALKLSDRYWTCPKCRVSHDRDILGAQNIKRFALAKVA